VVEYFNDTGRRQRDCPEMYLKTAIILTVFVAFYLLLVLLAATWWQALPLSILLGLSMAAIGFNIEHDGSHQAYSKRAWINRLMGNYIVDSPSDGSLRKGFTAEPSLIVGLLNVANKKYFSYRQLTDSLHNQLRYKSASCLMMTV
jgi:hypothetical protein